MPQHPRFPPGVPRDLWSLSNNSINGDAWSHWDYDACRHANCPYQDHEACRSGTIRGLYQIVQQHEHLTQIEFLYLIWNSLFDIDVPSILPPDPTVWSMTDGMLEELFFEFGEYDEDYEFLTGREVVRTL